MEQLIEAILKWLKETGFSAVRQMPQGVFPQLKGSVIAVGVRKAEAKQAGFFSYLGLWETDGKLVSVYGKTLEAEVSMQVITPQGLGAKRCMQETDALLTKLSQPIDGVTLSAVSVGECRYEAEADVFICTVCAQARAYLYAVSNEEETEFTDFILKGEAQ